MKFMLRFVLVLLVSVGLGFALYYAVQALPDDPPRFDAATVRFEPGSDQLANPEFRPGGNPPERGERRDRGISLRGLAGVVGKTVMFSVITFIVVMITMLFKRKPVRIQPPTS
ncbi:MAG: hypothetical protein AB1649_14745 [Chloroflexota bacterium]